LEGVENDLSILFMLQQIGEVVVFGLESRQDRWLRCLEILKENKVTEVTHFTTVKDEIQTHRYAAKDFIRLLRLKRESEYLVFFEDDFELTIGWEEVLKKAWSELPKDFDMLYLGANLTERPSRITDNLLRVRGAWCMHGVIMSRQFMDYFLRVYNPDSMHVIDEWCREQARVRKFYMAYPMICYQRESYSDFEKKTVFYNIFNNKHYKRV
jgi:hypothetical protein